MLLFHVEGFLEMHNKSYGLRKRQKQGLK